MYRHYVWTDAQQYDEARRKAESEYAAFREKANAEYAAFLECSWRPARQEPSKPKPAEPEPPRPPRPQHERKPSMDRLPQREVVPVPQAPKLLPAPAVPAAPTMQFALYGEPCAVHADRSELQFRLKSVSEKGAAEAWKLLSQEKYNGLLHDCLERRDELRLEVCDVGFPKEQVANILMTQLPAFGGVRQGAHTFAAERFGTMKARVSVDRRLIDYLNDYPLSDAWDFYARAGLSEGGQGRPISHDAEPDPGQDTVCDPTYIGADIGMTMPQFKGVEAKLVML